MGSQVALQTKWNLIGATSVHTPGCLPAPVSTRAPCRLQLQRPIDRASWNLLPQPAEAQDTLGSLQDIEAYFQALVTSLAAVGVPGGRRWPAEA